MTSSRAPVTECADCHAPVSSLLDLLVHLEDCPSANVCVVIGITKNGTVFSYPEFKPSPLIPDIPALLRYMADKVRPA